MANLTDEEKIALFDATWPELAGCQRCDGDGRIWNNADPTSGQWVECECTEQVSA